MIHMPQLEIDRSPKVPCGKMLRVPLQVTNMSDVPFRAMAQDGIVGQEPSGTQWSPVEAHGI